MAIAATGFAAEFKDAVASDGDYFTDCAGRVIVWVGQGHELQALVLLLAELVVGERVELLNERVVPTLEEPLVFGDGDHKLG
jgi:hypothetical protein